MYRPCVQSPVPQKKKKNVLVDCLSWHLKECRQSKVREEAAREAERASGGLGRREHQEGTGAILKPASELAGRVGSAQQGRKAEQVR